MDLFVNTVGSDTHRGYWRPIARFFSFNVLIFCRDRPCACPVKERVTTGGDPYNTRTAVGLAPAPTLRDWQSYGAFVWSISTKPPPAGPRALPPWRCAFIGLF